MKETSPWYKKKTNVAVISALVAAGIAFGFGEMELKEFITAVSGGIIAIFLRQGVAKAEGGKE